MKRSTLYAACAAAAVSMLGACTTEPTVAVNTTPAPAPAVAVATPAVVTPAPVGTTVMGAGTFSAADRDFALKAALSNMMEIGASQMAPKHTSSPDVLNLAATMDRDHTMAMNDLMAIMRSRGMPLPGDISPSQRHVMDKLGTDYGYDYDRDFVRLAGIRAHENDIAMFQQQMPQLSDPALRDWAARTLPHMQTHLQMAQDIWGHMAG